MDFYLPHLQSSLYPVAQSCWGKPVRGLRFMTNRKHHHFTSSTKTFIIHSWSTVNTTVKTCTLWTQNCALLWQNKWKFTHAPSSKRVSTHCGMWPYLSDHLNLAACRSVIFSCSKITWSLLFKCNAKSLILIFGQTTWNTSVSSVCVDSHPFRL